MRTSRKTDFRSSKNNFCGHDISQRLDREPPSLSPHFLSMMKNGHLPKISILLQFGDEILALSCYSDSIQILIILSMF